MARPAFVLCDTDALIQFLLAKEIRPLRILRSAYSIQPVIVPEVELELLSSRKFSTRIAPELKKALAHDLLRVLSKPVLEAHYGAPPGASIAAAASLENIAKTGRQFQRFADLGESHTLAAALVLGVPALSNDRSALDALITNGLPVPGTVLRTFDLIALCNQVNEMSANECDAFRALLIGEKEHVPACFRHASFADGLKDFYPRICDMRHAPIGRTENEALPYATVLDL